jgi:hypothetical protein
VALKSRRPRLSEMPGGGGQREGDLVLDLKLTIDLPVQREPVQLAARDHIREASGAAVTGLEVALHQRVLSRVAREGDMQLSRYLRLGQRHRVREVGGQLVQRAPVGGDRLAQHAQHGRAELFEIEQPHHLADHGQHALLYSGKDGPDGTCMSAAPVHV